MCVFLESGGFLGGWMCVFLESGASREAGCAYFSSEEALISIFTENPCVKTSIPAVVFFFWRGLLLCSPGHFCAALTTAADVFRMLDLGGRHPPLQN